MKTVFELVAEEILNEKSDLDRAIMPDDFTMHNEDNFLYHITKEENYFLVVCYGKFAHGVDFRFDKMHLCVYLNDKKDNVVVEVLSLSGGDSFQGLGMLYIQKYVQRKLMTVISNYYGFEDSDIQEMETA